MAPFNVTDVCEIDGGLMGQGFLGEAPLLSYAPDVSANNLAPLHCRNGEVRAMRV
jgi:hypothetical protein